MKRQCHCCMEPLRGRSDKKYCNDACRSHHFHQLHAEERRSMREINRILRRNHRILNELSRAASDTGRRESLLRLGFYFDYFTHCKEIEGGMRAYFCYDLGYVVEKGGYYRLIRDEELAA